MKYVVFSFFVGIVLFFLTTERVNHENEEFRYRTAFMTIGDTEYTLKIADTPQKRSLGLGFTKPLKENEGMLFVFEEPGAHGFWMKNVDYPLDIIWISDVLRITDIAENIQPESYPDTFTPTQDVRLAVELPGLAMQKNGAVVGDRVQLVLPD
jgi:uncharacterized membrane protein (UPF0127 family)